MSINVDMDSRELRVPQAPNIAQFSQKALLST